MNLSVLAAELAVDPLERGYAAMTAADAADSLNSANRTVIKPSMSGDEIFQQTDATEFGELSDAKRSQWLAFCGRAGIDPRGAANVAFVAYVFGGGSSTLTALAAARQVIVSRATELGLDVVHPGHVQNARL